MISHEWVITFFALLPIIWLLVSIGALKISTHISSLVAWIMTVVIAAIFFSMPAKYIFQASVEGVMLALHPILLVIISALFVYNMTIETGSMEVIKNTLLSISGDRRIQVLILAFGFGSFLESVAGFGTAVAIPAGIMIAMGFNPFTAAIICLVTNTVPVAFGVLGIPITTLAQVTSLPLQTLSAYTAVQLAPFAVFLPIVIILILTKSIKGLKGVLGVSIFSGTLFAVGQMIMAIWVAPELAAVVGSLLSLLLVVLWVKIWPIKEPWDFKTNKVQAIPKHTISMTKAVVAWSPYILILLLIIATRLLPFLDFLHQFPFVLESRFYNGDGGKPLVFQLGTGAGTILFISAIVGGFIQKADFNKIMRVLMKTIIQLKKTIITVIAVVAVAKIMGYSGMAVSIAMLFVAVSGKYYPFIAPFIGAIGTFITGSDTSSNVFFGNLQKQAATELHISREWIAAANASGATAGKMISPQSISIAVTATGLAGSEGKLLSVTIKYCLIYTLLLGAVVFVFSGAIQ